MKPEAYIERLQIIKSKLKSEDLNQLENEIESLIHARPERVGAYLLKVEIALRKKRISDAIKILEGARAKCSDDRISIQLTILYSKNGEHKKALFLAKKLVDQYDQNIQLLYAYARSLKATNEVNNSITFLKKCLTLDPNHLSSLNELAGIYFEGEDFDKAKQLYHKISRISPLNPIIWLNLGNVHVKEGLIQKAISAFKQVIELDVTLADAYYNLGQVYANILNQKEDSLKWYQNGARHGKGDLNRVLEILSITMKWQLSDWSDYDVEKGRLNELLVEYIESNSSSNLIPYELSYAGIDPALYKQVAIKYARSLKKYIEGSRKNKAYDYSISNQKIKVGYYSPNFYLHPGGLLIRTLFDHHDRSQFEIHAFSLSSYKDLVTHDIEESVDYFHDVSKLRAHEIADLINREGVDVLVALAGYNTAMKLNVLALKPAPIQIMMLGAHETTGSDFVDYVLSDSIVFDDGLNANFTESIITLPCSIMFNCELPPLEKATQTNRSDHNLPEDKFVFASFNHPRKLDPNTLNSWVKILQKVPNSVLWLYDGGNEKVGQSLLQFFTMKGVNHQIRLADKRALNEHWERIHHADLLLDCFNYNAHFTAIEFLRNNVPMITLKGNTHNSRLGASILHYGGLPNLITRSKEEYVDLAIEMADNKQLFKETKKKLMAHGQILFDEWVQVKYLEKAYLKAIDNYENGHLKSFKIVSDLPYDAK